MTTTCDDTQKPIRLIDACGQIRFKYNKEIGVLAHYVRRGTRIRILQIFARDIRENGAYHRVSQHRSMMLYEILYDVACSALTSKLAKFEDTRIFVDPLPADPDCNEPWYTKGT